PHNEAEVQCALQGVQVSAVTGSILTADEMGAYNTFQRPEYVIPAHFSSEIRIEAGHMSTVIPPMSVCAFEIQG
ncbi:MAG TPA: alpha-N-arabinofuranosidase, partial [Ktedonobacter sp.]|nr:alpha-N-arabinofuranosidase [Ktedonobacter sp.]